MSLVRGLMSLDMLFLAVSMLVIRALFVRFVVVGVCWLSYGGLGKVVDVVVFG
jgi:hypothetical protein